MKLTASTVLLNGYSTALVFDTIELKDFDSSYIAIIPNITPILTQSIELDDLLGTIVGLKSNSAYAVNLSVNFRNNRSALSYRIYAKHYLYNGTILTEDDGLVLLDSYTKNSIVVNNQVTHHHSFVIDLRRYVDEVEGDYFEDIIEFYIEFDNGSTVNDGCCNTTNTFSTTNEILKIPSSEGTILNNTAIPLPPIVLDISILNTVVITELGTLLDDGKLLMYVD